MNSHVLFTRIAARKTLSVESNPKIQFNKTSVINSMFVVEERSQPAAERDPSRLSIASHESSLGHLKGRSLGYVKNSRAEPSDSVRIFKFRRDPYVDVVANAAVVMLITAVIGNFRRVFLPLADVASSSSSGEEGK